mgnify:CR=1 FL=1
MGHHVATYPADEQYEVWKIEAEERDMSLSEYVNCMAEAGRKKFEVDSGDGDLVRELREQVRDLYDELEKTRERNDRLERAVYRGEREMIMDYIAENPGCSVADITQHVRAKSSQRVVDEVEFLLTDDITEDGDGGFLARILSIMFFVPGMYKVAPRQY